MNPRRLARLLDVLEQKKRHAERRFFDAETTRRQITDQIESHQRHLESVADFPTVDPRLHLVLVDTHLRCNARWADELKSLQTLLANYDRDHFQPRRNDLLKATRKIASLQRLVERHRVTEADLRRRRAQGTLDELAARRWSTKRTEP